MARNSLKSVMKLIDAEKEELPIEQIFLNDLRRSIEITDEKNSRPGSQSYKPSGMNCIRQSYYVVTGAERDKEDINHTIIGICESGSDRHERIQNAVLHMKDNEMDCEYINVADYVRQRKLTHLNIVKEPNFEAGEFETKLYWPEMNMSFLCDGIIRYRQHYYILEIKTETVNKFFGRKEVDPSHHQQATAYSLAFGINEVLFLYECRDNCDKKAFLFTVTDDMKQELVGYITTCDDYIKRKEVPPVPDDVPKKTCSYCSYKGRCKEDA